MALQDRQALIAAAFRPLDEAALAGTTRHALSPALLRHDLWVYLSYLDEHDVKRTYRGNLLPPKDAGRLLKQMAAQAGGVPAAALEGWLGLVEDLALALGLVRYDTKGQYVGYSSFEPTFRDNWIGLHDDAIAAYLALDPLAKELRIFEALAGALDNEFYAASRLFDSKPFDGFGRAVGHAARMDLPAIRSALLGLLARCPTGVWLDFDALVAYMRKQAPDMLIAKERLKSRELGEQVATLNRYATFRERGPGFRTQEVAILDTEPSAYARVEGRYLAFFLEAIPSYMGLVELARQPGRPSPSGRPLPTYGQVRAFKVSPLATAMLEPEAPDRAAWQATRITALPTFELLIESPTFCEPALDLLEPYVTIRERLPVTRAVLDKKRVMAAFSEGRSLDAVLADLTAAGVPALPANVRFELESWAGRADTVILHRGVAVVEVADDAMAPRVAAAFRAEDRGTAIGPGLALYPDPDFAIESLDAAGLLPEVRRTHERALQALAGPTPSRSRWGAAAAAPARRAVSLGMTPAVVLEGRDAAFMKVVRACLDAGARPYATLASERQLLVAPEVRDWLKTALPAFPEAAGYAIEGL